MPFVRIEALRADQAKLDGLGRLVIRQRHRAVPGA
jgi:hypothetical protein